MKNKVTLLVTIFLLVAAVAALAVGIYALVKAYNSESDAARRARLATEALNKTMLEGKQAASKNVIEIKLLVAFANDHTKSEELRKQALDDLNEIMGTTLTITDNLTTATENYIKVLVQKEQYEATIKAMAEINQKLLDTKTLLEEAEPAWYDYLWNSITGFSVQSIAMKNATVWSDNYIKSVGDLNAQYKTLEQQLS